MKKKTFIILFVTAQVFFVVFPIYKQSKLIELSYSKQKYEKLKNELIEYRQTLKHKVYSKFNQEEIKKFAQNQLNMQKIQLGQLKKLELDDAI